MEGFSEPYDESETLKLELLLSYPALWHRYMYAVVYVIFVYMYAVCVS